MRSRQSERSTRVHCTLSSRIGTDGPGDRIEQVVDGFVVDLVRGDLLVEIQTGSFAPLRRKLELLTRQHRVRLVAPLPLVRTIIRLSDQGELLSARPSPRRGRVEDIFNRLVSIPSLLCHPHFELELLLTLCVPKTRFG
jgi:hypothetical protein